MTEFAWTDKFEKEMQRLMNALVDMAGVDAAFFVAGLEFGKVAAMGERPSWASALDALQQMALEADRIVRQDRPRISESDGSA